MKKIIMIVVLQIITTFCLGQVFMDNQLIINAPDEVNPLIVTNIHPIRPDAPPEEWSYVVVKNSNTDKGTFYTGPSVPTWGSELITKYRVTVTCPKLTHGQSWVKRLDLVALPGSDIRVTYIVNCFPNDNLDIKGFTDEEGIIYLRFTNIGTSITHAIITKYFLYIINP